MFTEKHLENENNIDQHLVGAPSCASVAVGVTWAMHAEIRFYFFDHILMFKNIAVKQFLWNDGCKKWLQLVHFPYLVKKILV